MITFNHCRKPGYGKGDHNVEWNDIQVKDGGRTITINGHDYSYLFWEALTEQHRPLVTFQSTYTITVHQESFQSTIRTIMSSLGFTAKDIQDFIVYWQPQLLRFDALALRLLTPEEFSRFTTLTVDPKPDRIIRLFIQFQRAAVEDVEVISEDDLKQMVSRAFGECDVGLNGGLKVLEWGGMICREGFMN